jgi:endonuclease YncB( thermonuclease family)
LVVGQEVSWSVFYTVPSGQAPLEFGSIFLSTPGGNVDVALAIVSQGWAKVRDSRRDESELDQARRVALEKAQEEAVREKRGIWKEGGDKVRLSSSRLGWGWRRCD